LFYIEESTVKGKKEWRASSTGPDWTDIARTLREVERLHAVWVSLRILNAGLQNSNGLRIVCSAFTNVLGATRDTGVVSLMVEWPNSSNATLEGAAYALLIQLDARLSDELWAQGKLPLA
jgi:hypothetical protein